MREHFDRLAALACSLTRSDEVCLLSWSGEESSFVRLSRNRFRQAGSVRDSGLALTLVRGRRHATLDLTLSGTGEDEARVEHALAELRGLLGDLPEDPHLLYSTEPWTSCRQDAAELPPAQDMAAEIVRLAEGRDLVGILAAGPVSRGFASSLGHRNWCETTSFNLDFCLYHQDDKAVKTSLGGRRWDGEDLAVRLTRASRDLETMALPPRTVPPGRYRVFLSPAALGEIMGLLSWGGFGLADQRTRQSPLLALALGEARLDERVRLIENTAAGVAPNFQEQGFARPDEVVLIDGGRLVGQLVSPRSAREYGVPPNGASAAESPLSLDLAPGRLPLGEALARLDTGILIGNLWYLNYSDRPACRLTGMTRFATFWVEGGRVVAPLSVMRFDDTIYRILGEGLVDLTVERDFLIDQGTYGGRSLSSMRLPGALVEGFALTL
jgi:predicted Zn-dependent protease